jgi:hypothetical protein
VPKFSKHFRINAPQSQLDFVDVSTDYDTKVYVDPYAIEMRDDVWSAQCSELIRSFFLEVLSALRAGDDLRAENLMSHLHEPAETFLGVSKFRPQGRGVGRMQARQLVKRIKKSKAFKTGVLSDLSEVALFVDRIGRDKISDLTTNVIREKLVEYTRQQCELYGIALEEYNGPPLWDSRRKNWVSKKVELPRIKGVPVMLVPKYTVRRELSLNSQEFYNKQITDFLIAEHERAVSSLVQALKAPPAPTKTEIREKNPKSKTMLADIAAEHPHLLDIYKDLAREEARIMVNIAKDDISVPQACVDLEKALRATPPGREHADRYHMIAMHILTLCFFPDLIQPHKEWDINEGRKRADIVYTNAANEGFFAHRRDAKNTVAAMLIVECKNYTKDIANPEIDQLLGRFDNNRGYFGFVTCRAIDKKELVLKRCQDLAQGGRAFIMVLADEDMIAFLEAKKNGDEKKLQSLLHAGFRAIIS